MAEPNATHASGLPENVISDRLTTENAPGIAASLDADGQLEGQRLEMSVAQLQVQLRNQKSRIENLEQALDQALANLQEFRVQIASQQFLEQQLASTEEIANVQQQAITQLKLQIAQKQAAFEAQIQTAQEQEQIHQQQLALAETLTQSQQIQLEQLQAQLSRDRAEVEVRQQQLEHCKSLLNVQQQQIVALELQEATARSLAANLEGQLNEAQKQIKRLYRELSDRHTAINELEARLEGDLPLEPPAVSIQTTEALRTGEGTPPTKIEELEAQISKQLANQALLQQACQELEADRELSQTRITDLERQAAEMQEQILSQAQQASEYEAAVQHWKDRFYNTQDKVSQLKLLLETKLAELPPDVTELLAAIQAASTLGIDPAASTSKADSVSQDLKLDLPDFLTRRRTYRNR